VDTAYPDAVIRRPADCVAEMSRSPVKTLNEEDRRQHRVRGRSTVAVSIRTDLRQRERDYNLGRFLEAVPEADVAPDVRVIRSLRRR
jgi:hypothetical protein